MTQQQLIRFDDIQKRDQLELYANKSVTDGEDPVRTVTFIADKEPSGVFESNPVAGFDVNIEIKEEFTKLSLSRKIEHPSHEDGYKTLRAEVFVISHDRPQVYSAFAITDKNIFEKVVRHYISHLPPTISTSYLTTNELKGLFDTFEEQVSGRIIVDEAVIKSHQGDTDIRYIDDPYRHLFNSPKVAEGPFFVDKIKFGIRGGQSEFEGYISRHGDTRYRAGVSGIYFNQLLHLLGDAIIEKGSIFENKSRDYGSRDAERLEITYEEGELSGTDSNKDLIGALEGLKNASMTVYHDNPYMHASILDYNDGTSADIFITSSDTVSIIPGFEASRESLTRICDQINESFLEGEVREADRSDQKFSDYFG